MTRALLTSTRINLNNAATRVSFLFRPAAKRKQNPGCVCFILINPNKAKRGRINSFTTEKELSSGLIHLAGSRKSWNKVTANGSPAEEVFHKKCTVRTNEPKARPSLDTLAISANVRDQKVIHF